MKHVYPKGLSAGSGGTNQKDAMDTTRVGAEIERGNRQRGEKGEKEEGIRGCNEMMRGGGINP